MPGLMFYACQTLSISFVQQISNEYLLHTRHKYGYSSEIRMEYPSCRAHTAGVKRVR